MKVKIDFTNTIDFFHLQGDLYWLKNRGVSAAFDKVGRMIQLHLHGSER